MFDSEHHCGWTNQYNSAAYPKQQHHLPHQQHPLPQQPQQNNNKTQSLKRKRDSTSHDSATKRSPVNPYWMEQSCDESLNLSSSGVEIYNGRVEPHGGGDVESYSGLNHPYGVQGSELSSGVQNMSWQYLASSLTPPITPSEKAAFTFQQAHTEVQAQVGSLTPPGHNQNVEVPSPNFHAPPTNVQTEDPYHNFYYSRQLQENPELSYDSGSNHELPSGGFILKNQSEGQTLQSHTEGPTPQGAGDVVVTVHQPNLTYTLSYPDATDQTGNNFQYNAQHSPVTPGSNVSRKVSSQIVKDLPHQYSKHPYEHRSNVSSYHVPHHQKSVSNQTSTNLSSQKINQAFSQVSTNEYPCSTGYQVPRQQHANMSHRQPCRAPETIATNAVADQPPAARTQAPNYDIPAANNQMSQPSNTLSNQPTVLPSNNQNPNMNPLYHAPSRTVTIPFSGHAAPGGTPSRTVTIPFSDSAAPGGTKSKRLRPGEAEQGAKKFTKLSQGEAEYLKERFYTDNVRQKVFNNLLGKTSFSFPALSKQLSVI